MQKITPFLWFDGNAEEAVDFYCSVFRKGRKGKVMRWPDDRGVLTVEFVLEDMGFVALNGGPEFKFTEAVSFCIECETQDEVDYYWDKLGEGGQYQPCGWLKDRYGLSWQVTPATLLRLVNDPDRARAGRAMDAMMKMKKIIIADIEKAVA
jgi:predicted 3-demethylubiquinone-9 3-methyltransferase (glyoxalase superfamily)